MPSLYNDPVIFLEDAVDVAQACREVGVNSVAVTAGYICDQPRRDFFVISTCRPNCRQLLIERDWYELGQ